MIGQLLLLFLLCVVPFLLFFYRSFWAPDGFSFLKQTYDYKMSTSIVLLKGGSYHFIFPFTKLLKNKHGHTMKIPTSSHDSISIIDHVFKSKDGVSIVTSISFKYSVKKESTILKYFNDRYITYTDKATFDSHILIEEILITTIRMAIELLNIKIIVLPKLKQVLINSLSKIIKSQYDETGIEIESYNIDNIGVVFDPNQKSTENLVTSNINSRYDEHKKEDYDELHYLVNCLEKSVKSYETVKKNRLNPSII